MQKKYEQHNDAALAFGNPKQENQNCFSFLKYGGTQQLSTAASRSWEITHRARCALEDRFSSEASFECFSFTQSFVRKSRNIQEYHCPILIFSVPRKYWELCLGAEMYLARDKIWMTSNSPDVSAHDVIQCGI